MILYVLNFQI